MNSRSSTHEHLPRGIRVLTRQERSKICSEIYSKFMYTSKDKWNPRDISKYYDISICVQTSWLEYSVPIEEVRIIAAKMWSRFWFIQEGYPYWTSDDISSDGDFEVDAEHLYLSPAGETICTPMDFQWISYTDHNGATYLMGSWLVKVVVELWPDWEKYIWKSPFYTHPPKIRSIPWWEL